MAIYVGKRVVPIVRGNWDNTQPYEMLSIVLDTNSKHSYISKKEVPAGIAITNTEYWALFTVSLETAAIAAEMGPQIAAEIKAVRYEEMNLTEEEKQISRHNIGASTISIEGTALVIND